MADKFYKIFMALHSNKVVLRQGLFMITLDIKNAIYNIWYLDNLKLPKLMDSCADKDILKFKWCILMNRRGL